MKHFAVAVAVCVAAAFASTAGAATTPNFVIQDAVIESPNTLLVSGTSNCVQLFNITVQVTAPNSSAFGAGTQPVEPTNNGNWDVLVTGPATFVKEKAQISAFATCVASDGSTSVVDDTREILLTS